MKAIQRRPTLPQTLRSQRVRHIFSILLVAIIFFYTDTLSQTNYDSVGVIHESPLRRQNSSAQTAQSSVTNSVPVRAKDLSPLRQQTGFEPTQKVIPGSDPESIEQKAPSFRRRPESNGAETPYNFDNSLYPWLEGQSRRVDMPPDSLPPNTDEYLLLFSKVGPNPYSHLGRYMTNLGDQNGDGYDDIVFRNSDPEQAEFYYGGDPMDTETDMIFADTNATLNGYGLTYGENVNSYEHGVLLMESHYIYQNDTARIYLYNCGEEFDNTPDLLFMDEGIWSSSGFGFNNCIADLNDDGYKDVITSNWNYGQFSPNGKVYVFYGGPDMDNIVDFTITSSLNNFTDNFGGSIGVGDINDDGVDDLLVVSSSTAYLFNGSSTLDSIPDWQYTSAILKHQCSFIPDINGDGFDDIILGMHTISWSNFAVFFGGETLSEEPDMYLYHWPSDEIMSVSYAGDVNNDGYGDIIAADHVTDCVFIHYGGDPPNQDADLYFYSSAGYVGCPGDVDGDGVDDIGFNDELYEGQLFGQVFIYGDSTFSGIREYRPEPMIRNFTLHQNYPNPFNGATVIDFSVNTSETVYLKIFDMLGRQVYSVGNSFSPGASISFRWDGIDMNGNKLSSGVYFLELTDGSEKQIKKLQIVR